MDQVISLKCALPTTQTTTQWNTWRQSLRLLQVSLLEFETQGRLVIKRERDKGDDDSREIEERDIQTYMYMYFGFNFVVEGDKEVSKVENKCVIHEYKRN